MRNYVLPIIVAVILAGCSQFSKTPTTTNSIFNSANENKTATNSTDNGRAETNSADTATKTTDIAGTYAVTGSNPEGGDSYEGTLTVAKRDSVYQFSWDAGEQYDGVGVQKGNTLAVAYATGTSGKGCGAVIYEIGADGALDGKFGEWGVNDSGTEQAVPADGAKSLSGSFDVTGTNVGNKSYQGKLVIKKDTDEIYQLAWDVGAKYVGTGIKRGNYLAAGSGPKECGFVVYEINGDTLSGKWGVPGTTRLGTEKATKK